MEPADEARLLQSMLLTAERVLSQAWGGPVRPEVQNPRGSSLNGEQIRLDGSARPHSRLIRCSVVAAPDQAPETVMVKSFQECAWKAWKGAYDPNEQHQGSTAWRFFNEWAGMQFVQRLPSERPLAPRLHGGDRAAGLIVMEDLGEGGCLADLLFGTDPVRAEAGLVEAAATVGQLHAASLGRAEEYRDLRASFGAYDWDFPWNRRAELDRQVQEVKRELQAACDSVGVSVPAGMDGEWSSMLTLYEPGSLFAFSADLGPDHYRYVDGRPRFIDFEASKYEPAFVDALIGRFVFPSSYLVNRLPPEMAPRMEAAYRAELVKACPEARDDRWFNTSLVNAGGLLILSRLSDRPQLAEDLKADRPWGHASMRQRRLLHLDAFAAMTEEFGHLAVLGGLTRALAARLRTLWEDVAELPLYPAFRGQAQEFC
jgi:hypothetical protein